MALSSSRSSLLSKGMIAVFVAQFFSAFGDNALLFAILAFVKHLNYPDWSKPVLQMAFVIAYIITAPFVGQIADNFAKGRVMMLANGLKLLGALAVCVGINPFIGYAMVGLGAASYSPAKYGILSELTSGDELVKANSLIESATIVAILSGSIAGGYIADQNIIASLIMSAVVYGIAVIANLYIPKLKPEKSNITWQISTVLVNFFNAFKVLWQHKYSRLTLLGTALFWGAGVTLRFLLIDWVPAALGILDNKTPTILNAVVAIGIIIGAGLAAKLVSLNNIMSCIPAGIVMGIAVSCFVLQQQLVLSYVILILIGILGGFFLVPLNAFLQNFGKKSIGSGNAIAIQNINENSMMLIMLGLYSVAVMLHIPVVVIGFAFGGLFATAIILLWLWSRKA